MSHKTLLERLTKEQIVELLEECAKFLGHDVDCNYLPWREAGLCDCGLVQLRARLDQALSEFNRTDSTTERGGGGYPTAREGAPDSACTVHGTGCFCPEPPAR